MIQAFLIGALFLASGTAHAALSSEFGYRGATQSKLSHESSSLVYIQPEFKHSLERDTLLEFTAGVRARLNTAYQTQTQAWKTDSELSIRALHVSASMDHWMFKAGFQEVVWGETFGFSILDLVNPRDYRDPLILEGGWTRLPVAALNQQIFLGQWNIQTVFTPWPRLNLYPELPGLGSGSLPLEFAPEFGARVGTLLDNGLDVSLMYFRHWNRNLVTGPDFKPFLSRVHTLGMAVSYDWNSVILRNDFAAHFNQPFHQTGLGTQFQNVLGVDHTFRGDLSAGAQLQSEFRPTLGPTVLNWASARVGQTFFRNRLNLEVFLFKGIGNPDLWLQPKADWNISDAWTASLRWDLLGDNATQEGYLWPVQKETRVLWWIRAKI